MYYIAFSRIIITLAFAALILPACSSDYVPEETRVPIARVFDIYLYQDELKEVIPEGASPEDSSIAADNFIDLWVKKQLMLKKADLNLTPEQKDFEQQLEDFKQKLLIYTYRQKFIEQKLDTNTNYEDIATYYNENLQGFLLNREVVKAYLAKIPLNVPDMHAALKFVSSASPIDSANMIKFCAQYGGSFTNFNGIYTDFTEVLTLLPITVTNHETFLKQGKTIIAEDEGFKYLVRLYDVVYKGMPEPLESIDHNIKEILLTKKKKQMLDELEMNLFNDALNHKNIEYYTY